VTATLIDGRALARQGSERVAAAVDKLRQDGVQPTLAVVLPTADESSAWYVRSIRRAAEKVGVGCAVHELSGPRPAEIEDWLAALSGDPGVHGIVCQTPLPPGVRLEDVAVRIDPAKDVDGANPLSLGRLTSGLPAYAPATAAAVLEVLRHEEVPLLGKRVVVVGRSLVVGKPVAMLLLAEHATVTICHSRTRDLAAVCREADVLVAAVGRPALIGADFVKDGAVVIDVGTNPAPDGGLVGDVDTEAAAEHAARITPVPGGVGPVTTMLLLRQTVAAAGGTFD
jgi:methylenetetrahydrofolate dehydrogenase (NADP+)/methenyltetrahydrofolate cyclohydrolase